MDNNSRECLICGDINNTIILTCKDNTVSKEYFKIVKCVNCSFLFTNPIPHEIEIGNYYKNESYISHTNTNKGFINKIYQQVRKLTLNNKKQLVLKLNKGIPGSILDIGCGTGHFLETCHKNGWNVEGTEPDNQARNIASSIINKKIKPDIFEFSDEYKFDIISLWHVIEHIYSLNETIIKIKNLLQKNGFLIVAVPNYESYDGRYYKENWAAYDVPRHLYHFSKESMKTLMNKHNFKIMKILPMPYDSFYVSMISEKYKGNTSAIKQILNSIYRGIKSNFEKDNNSSLLYLIQHGDEH